MQRIQNLKHGVKRAVFSNSVNLPKGNTPTHCERIVPIEWLMVFMKYLFILLVLVLLIAAIAGTGAAAAGVSPGNRSGEVEAPVVRITLTLPHVPAGDLSAESETTERTRTVTPTPTRTPTRTASPTPSPSATRPPTTSRTPTPTASPTPQPTPRPTSVPVVTVTVFVYPNGAIYYPDYYYPGYPYPDRSYYRNSYLTVTSSPSNAIVILDGYTTQNTPYVFTGLSSGYHTVEIDYPGYEAYVTSINIENGAGQEIDARLVPLVSYGSLFVDSRPEGADVYVDGNYQGTSAVTVSGLVSGPHRVEFHLAGYEVLTQTVDVFSGQGTNVNAVLVPYSAASSSGSIDISSDLPGALVYLDGIYKGTAQSGTVFNIIAASPGSHSILLHVPGYTDFTRTIVVNSGQITHVRATFVQATPDQQAPGSSGQAGTIIASSLPAGGQVYLDDQFRGVAPVTIYNVNPGTHIVNMKLAGYSDWSTSVQVQAGQIAQVPATFTSTGSPVPTRAGLPVAVLVAALVTAGAAVSLKGRK
jgi:hypothetical protein